MSQQRRCLRCEKTFDSKGPGNRICGSCGLVNRHKGVMAEQRVTAEIRKELNKEAAFARRRARTLAGKRKYSSGELCEGIHRRY